ncbi:MAG: amidohydrolase family protein [Methyloceanibacter sp.]|jgi:imidazolonepropionase-like amidohydrolase|uniref:amidohydrolase family protein n=1 Tax=Methyloceanibacter sp. TaxID=1965321 RepID=UPI003C60E215
MYRIVLLLFVFIAVSAPIFAEDTDTKLKTLFANVNVFDGVHDKLIMNANVLVEGNLIKTVSTDPISADGATVIDGGGRTLMPGLADTHVHLAFPTLPALNVLTGDSNYNTLRSAKDAEAMLMRGLTVVRDMGGNVFGLKQAIGHCQSKLA